MPSVLKPALWVGGIVFALLCLGLAVFHLQISWAKQIYTCLIIAVVCGTFVVGYLLLLRRVMRRTLVSFILVLGSGAVMILQARAEFRLDNYLGRIAAVVIESFLPETLQQNPAAADLLRDLTQAQLPKPDITLTAASVLVVLICVAVLVWLTMVESRTRDEMRVLKSAIEQLSTSDASALKDVMGTLSSTQRELSEEGYGVIRKLAIALNSLDLPDGHR